MKSKTSYFNKAIFHKNFTLYWPLWGMYSLLMLFIMPLAIELNFYQMRLWAVVEEANRNYKLDNLIEILDSRVGLILVFVFAVIYAMALFGYLFNTKSANMIHSLPVTREELFGTNYITGLLFLIVPQIIAFVLSVFVCIFNGVTQVQYPALWFLSMMVASICFFSMATLCCFLTGQMLAVPIYYMALNFWYPVVQLLVGGFVSFNGYGLSATEAMDVMNCDWLCPPICLYRNVYFMAESIERADGYVTTTDSFMFRGGKELLIYFLVGVVMAVIAYIFYRKRAIECAQDLLSFEFLKPIFRWVIGIVVGIATSIGVQIILVSFEVGLNTPLIIFLTIVLSVLFFFLADMFVQKSFRVINVKRMKECGLFFIFTLICTIFIRIGTGMVENQIPEEDRIQYVSLKCDGRVVLGKNQTEKILEVHRTLVENKNQFRYYENLPVYSEGNSNINLYYKLKDGRTLSRSYNVPHTEAGESILRGLEDELKKPEVYLESVFAETLGSVDEFREGYIDMFSDNNYVDSVSFGAAEAQKIYEAFYQDCKEGTAQQYNSYTYNYEMPSNCYKETVFISYYFKTNRPEEFQLYFSSGHNYFSYEERKNLDGSSRFYVERYISFGPECKNLIQTLIDLDIIKSEEDLHTYQGEY